MEKPRIVVVGSSNTDMVIKSERLPGPGETILGGDFIMAAGGKGANQAVAAARIGGEVTFVARVGDDMFGSGAIENFKTEGMNTNFIVVDQDNPSGVALINVDHHGENSISVASSANNALSEENVSAASEAIADAQVILIQLEIPLDTVRHAAKLAYESGTQVILNPAPAQELDDTLLGYISVLTPNESEAELLTGVKVTNESTALEAAGILKDKGVGTVVITMGSQGAFVVTDDESTLVPSKEITPIDTTAAGDAFNGALAFAIAEQRPMVEAVRFANLVGALSATKMGAQPSMPTSVEVEAFSNT